MIGSIYLAVDQTGHAQLADLLIKPYIGSMVLRSSRGRPLNAPAAFIHPCQPVVAKQPPAGPGWAQELKHDGYRLLGHVRNPTYGNYSASPRI
jgi:ATP-dependent DNA ligase